MAALAAVIVAGVLLASQGGSSQGGTSSSRTLARGHSLQSFFEDEALLVYQPMTTAGDDTVARTLATLRSLGVDRLRILITWLYVAPDGLARAEPKGFDPTEPAAYPAANWAPYDRVIRMAARDGLGVDLDLSGPAPLWANVPGSPDPAYAYHYIPSGREFQQFATAVGRRYDGSYRPSGQSSALPRVSFWSVWNEPNQPGWLAPQWVHFDGRIIPLAPRLYRALIDGEYAGLRASGHTTASDTILIGELAPEGCVAGSPCPWPRLEWAQPPIPFLQSLYCLSSSFKPLTGVMARIEGCPTSGARSAFVDANPGLFDASGFAHHPYAFYLAPNVSMPNPQFVPLSDLHRLEVALDSTFAAYGSARKLPIWLTEYGYETSPPRPFPPMTSLRDQSLYLDQSVYMAWRDPRVRSTAQFLLQDSAPDKAYPPGSRRYWSTFQTGLEFLGGKPKPALGAYRLPIFLPRTSTATHGRLLVWAMLRPAPNGTRQRATIEWRPRGGGYRPLQTITIVNATGIFEAEIRPPATGAVKVVWRSPAGQLLTSRAVGVSVTG